MTLDNLRGLVKGKKTWIVLILHALYTAFMGGGEPTYADPAGGGDMVDALSLDAALATIRATLGRLLAARNVL